MIVWQVISIVADLVIIALFTDWVIDNAKFAWSMRKKNK